MHAFIRRALCAAIASLAATAAHAAYPEQPVRIVVAFAPGSGTDNVARYYATRLSEELKQPFVVENKPGANGSIAATQVARTQPDGYTLFLGSNSTLSAAPFLFKKLPYEPLKDFTAVARLSDIPSMLVVGADSPIRDFDQFIGKARAEPGRVTWANANTAHLAAGMALTKQAQLDMISVPYKSSPQALTDVIGGQVTAMVVDTSAGTAFVQQGKVRALAVTTARPVAAMPGVPSMSGRFPGIDVYSWLGIVGPAGMPDEVVTVVNKAILKINASEDTVRFLRENAGAEPPPSSSPAEFTQFMHAQLEVWRKLLRDANVEPM
ncbi:tripartite tricarboxylate transporter substrate binding protein [Bordetella bronchiseptica]|uniref:ABC transporter substrate-binding protein n=1 Tax=Bordetella genomosp. 6 TaxID=463024 RepID=A0ABX4FA29_9BORD|nr:tripartite tricarboxylate transporter substrate binding protein [Bordetella genomosp. 6]OZI73412.1 hypothetical protein CAL23_19835 [Bordetella genomosp. 6]